MKKILQIAKYYYPFLGGTEQVSRDMTRTLLGSDDIEQKIICFNEDADDGNMTCRRKETVHDFVDGVEVIRCGCETKVASQSLSASYSRELKRLMDDFCPDIVVLHYPNPFATHFLLRHKKKKFKLIVYWHLDITKQKILKKVFRRQNLALIERADLILASAPQNLEQSEFTPYFGEKKQLLPLAIDEKSLAITQEEKQRAEEIRQEHEGETLGFFIGRHVPYKGLKYLIEASKELGSEKIHFFIAGSGELTEKLKEQAQGDDKVEFIGRITDSERRAYLYACDIVCFPSITRNEAFGLALAEGMYYGKPAVTFTIPGSGVNYVNIADETGIECPNCDSKAYAQALLMLSRDPQLREKYGSAARKRVLDNFTFERFSSNMRAIIDGLSE